MDPEQPLFLIELNRNLQMKIYSGALKAERNARFKN